MREFRIQKRDQSFKNHHPKRFAKPKSSAASLRLRVDGHTITEKTDILQALEITIYTALSVYQKY